MAEAINSTFLLKYIDERGINEGFEEFLTCQQAAKHLTYSNMDPKSIAQICKKINKQSEAQGHQTFSKADRMSNKWRKGQFKLFIWIALFYAFNQDKHIHQFVLYKSIQNDLDFNFLKTIFRQKTICRIQFQHINSFSFGHFYRKNWENNESSLLVNIVQSQISQQKKLQWKHIAFRLFQESNGIYFRTFGQCREMWTNHHDPNVVKQKWTLEEDYLLLSLVRERAKHWCKIALKFKGRRTVHMVKNRYNSFITLGKKINKKLTQKGIVVEMLNSINFKLKKKQKQLKKKLKELSNKSVQPSSLENFSQLPLQKQNTLNELLLFPSLQFQGLDLFQNEIISKNLHLVELQNLLNNLKLVDLNFSQIESQLKPDNLFQKLGFCNFEEIFQDMKFYQPDANDDD